MPWLEQVLFCNSGAEAVEAAIKFSRAATGRGTASGRSSAIACASPFNDLLALERALAAREAAGFVVEPIQGKGVNLPGDDYLPEAARLYRAHGTLFVADEIQTGMGRTGRFLASERWRVELDLVLLAKALSGGFVRLGAVACRREVFDGVFDRMTGRSCTARLSPGTTWPWPPASRC